MKWIGSYMDGAIGVVPALVLAIGKTTSLLTVQVQLDLELYISCAGQKLEKRSRDQTASIDLPWFTHRCGMDRQM